MKKKSILEVFAILAFFLPLSFNANAQVTIGSAIPPNKFSLLDLDTQYKKGGLSLPHLTEMERNALLDENSSVADKAIGTGLLIYNLDTNCQEYWNGNEWINLCQTTTNPVVDIYPAACAKIRVYGKYYKNAPLNNTHYLMLPVTVIKKGNYTFIATSNNGYYFQANGVFDTTGTFEIKLEGMGVPAQNGVDVMMITCNGAVIGTTCDVKITVGALTMGYTTDCDSIQVLGIYKTRQFMNNDNYVKMPVDVIVDGHTSFETNMVNGIRFAVSQQLTSLGADTLILKAQGTPKQAGKYTFYFTTDGSVKNTCNFEVNFISTLGTFDDPACKCLDIYDENPMAVNGEYWLQDCDDVNFPVTRTYCDIIDGGWTLVWSFSEKTARDVYVQNTVNGGTGNRSTMEVNGAYWNVAQDRPVNRITDAVINDIPSNYQINYANFRLNRAEWQHFPINNATPQLKVRIADSPINMNDEWAQNNYGIISPRSANENPIESTFTSRLVPSFGKVFGKKWEVKRSGGSLRGWDEVSGNRGNMTLYNSNNYCTHWNFSGSGSNSQFQVTPNRGGSNNTVAFTNLNNMFGWFGATEVNHHFGKCGQNGDDYSFSTKTCNSSNLHPHSFNNGEGRYLQWFVK